MDISSSSSSSSIGKVDGNDLKSEESNIKNLNSTDKKIAKLVPQTMSLIALICKAIYDTVRNISVDEIKSENVERSFTISNNVGERCYNFEDLKVPIIEVDRKSLMAKSSGNKEGVGEKELLALDAGVRSNIAAYKRENENFDFGKSAQFIENKMSNLSQDPKTRQKELKQCLAKLEKMDKSHQAQFKYLSHASRTIGLFDSNKLLDLKDMSIDEMTSGMVETLEAYGDAAKEFKEKDQTLGNLAAQIKNELTEKDQTLGNLATQIKNELTEKDQTLGNLATQIKNELTETDNTISFSAIKNPPFTAAQDKMLSNARKILVDIQKSAEQLGAMLDD